MCELPETCIIDSLRGVTPRRLLLLIKLLLRDGVLQGDEEEEMTSSNAFRRHPDAPSEDDPRTTNMCTREGSSMQGSRVNKIGDWWGVVV